MQRARKVTTVLLLFLSAFLRAHGANVGENNDSTTPNSLLTSEDDQTAKDDPCLTKPCKNDGNCAANAKEAICTCIGNWQGETCEKYDPCLTKPCKNDGNCAANDKEAVCTCIGNWKGETCEEYCNCGEYSKKCDYNWKGDKICDCFSGYVENYGLCEECNCGPYGSCIFKHGLKTCNCRPFAIEMNGMCIIKESTTSEGTTGEKTTVLPSTMQYCDCGYYSKSCRYNWKGDKICDCFPGYTEKYGSCDECNCGPHGSCRFQYGIKTCSCRPFFVEINGVCVEIRTSSKGTTDSISTSTIVSSTIQECDCGPRGKCTLEYGVKKCSCDALTSEKDGRCVDCYCGVNSKSCHFKKNGDKICKCTSGYAQAYGICKNCNCGVKARSCFYRKNGTKVCNCDFGYTQTNGYCTAICNKEKCVHGKCKVVGNDFKCRCNKGFFGRRCEYEIPTKSNKQDLWMIILLAIVIAILILLSAILCLLGRLRSKMSKK